MNDIEKNKKVEKKKITTKKKKIEKDENKIEIKEEIEKSKEIKPSKNMFNTVEVIVIMVITALFGALIGSAVTYFRDNGGLRVYDKNIKELISTYDEVIDNYYGEINNDELLESGIRGMIDYLNDPYSSYLDSEISEEFNEKLEGEYIGLGAEISLNVQTNILTVVTIFDNSPAQKSGLKEGDIIYKIEDKDISELAIEEITEIIKGDEVGTKVNLNVKRKEEELVIEFERGTVELTSVTGEIIEKDNKKIGLVTIEVFAKNSYKQFKNVVEDLQKQGAEYLILDVRDNNGGYLTTVKSIAEMFLDKKDVIFIVKDNEGEEKQLATKKKVIDIPTVVLINGGSASASEILAAALNENLGIDLVGLKTYGKGTVQKTKTLSTGAIIKYTIQEWLTPSGKSIDDDGISPTVEIEMDEKYYDNPTKENDSQLQKAIEIVLKK